MVMESVIKWHTEEPKKSGAYIATYKKTSECDAYVVALYRIGKNWETTSWDVIPSERVVAWCKLSDIEPYKEKK